MYRQLTVKLDDTVVLQRRSCACDAKPSASMLCDVIGYTAIDGFQGVVTSIRSLRALEVIFSSETIGSHDWQDRNLITVYSLQVLPNDATRDDLS